MHSLSFQFSERFAYPTAPQTQSVQISEGPLHLASGEVKLLSEAGRRCGCQTQGLCTQKTNNIYSETFYKGHIETG